MAKKKEPSETLSDRFIWKKGDFQVIKKKDVKKKVPLESLTAKHKAEVKKVIVILRKVIAIHKEDVQVVQEEPKKKGRQITETKSTCKACENVWFYGKKDQWEQFGNQYDNSCMKPSLCCTCSPLVLLIPDKKVTDLNKCPKCGSRAVYKEKVTHDV